MHAATVLKPLPNPPSVDQRTQRQHQLDDEARAAYAALGAGELQELVNLDPSYYQRRLKDLGLAIPSPPR